MKAKEKLFNKAVENNNFEEVQNLIQDIELDLLFRECKAIRVACENGFTDIVRLLLNDKRINPSARNNYPFRKAVINGHVEVVKLLLNDSRVNPIAFLNEPLVFAIQEGHIEIVKLLLEGRHVDFVSSDFCNILYEAVSSRSYDIVKMVLENDIIDSNGYYETKVAFDNNDMEILTLLWSNTKVKNSILKYDPCFYQELKKIDIKNKIKEF